MSNPLRRLGAPEMTVLGFAALILIGAGLLRLPIAQVHNDIGFLDALFTATSAVCVTGLIVVDTGSAFTLFGQGVILALIQLGGFGVMMIGTVLIFILGGRVSLLMRDAAGGVFLNSGEYPLNRMLGIAVGATLCIEAVGAFCLWLAWQGELGALDAVWPAVFHSISAFCNAGFSLFPDSIVAWRGNALVNVTLMPLIILGGLGFYVWVDLGLWWRRRKTPQRHRLSFHTRIVLAVSAILIAGPAIFFFVVERPHNFADMPLSTAWLCALFQSVTSRTAGFNSVEIGRLSNASLCMTMGLMFTGGAPGSMAGGVKVTTMGVMAAVVIAKLRRLPSAGMFGRSVNPQDLERAVVLLLLSFFYIGMIAMALMLSELGGAEHGQSRGMFLDLMFETVSAFGTVGLSTGVTPGLSVFGRLVIILTMFIGRLGPIVLVYGIAARARKRSFKYPAESIMIG